MNNPNISEEIHFANEELKIIQEEIAGYRMLRSTADKNLFNVFVVDSKDNLLACVAVDLTFEKVSAIVEALNNSVESKDENI